MPRSCHEGSRRRLDHARTQMPDVLDENSSIRMANVTFMVITLATRSENSKQFHFRFGFGFEVVFFFAYLVRRGSFSPFAL